MKHLQYTQAEWQKQESNLQAWLQSLAPICQLYKTYRMEYIAAMMLICSLMPWFTSIMAGIVLCTGDYAMPASYIRYLSMAVVLFCCVVAAPISIKYQRNQVKEHAYRLQQRSKEDVKLDDFTTVVEKIKTTVKIRTSNIVLNKIQEEIDNQKDIEALISTMESVDKPTNSTTAHVSESTIQDYTRLKEKYEKALDEEATRLAFATHFGYEFKCEWFSDLTTGLMLGVLLIMLWNVSTAILAIQQVKSDLALALQHMINFGMPMIVGAASLFIIRWAKYKELHKTFVAAKEKFGVEIDTSVYAPIMQEETKQRITDLQNKLAIVAVKLSYLVN